MSPTPLATSGGESIDEPPSSPASPASKKKAERLAMMAKLAEQGGARCLPPSN